MKTLTVLLALTCVGFVLSAAPGDVSVPTLLGFVNLPDRKCAVLKLVTPRVNYTRFSLLAEGQREGDIEVVRINPEKETVELRVAGTNAVLTLGSESQPASAGPLAIVLTNASLQPVLTLYADCAQRTLLRSPALPDCAFHIRAAPANRAEAAAVFENALAAQGIVSIPDGEKFLRIVPKAQAALARTRAMESKFTVAEDSNVMPPGSINWTSADLWQVLPIYASLVGRKLDQAASARVEGSQIVFKNDTPLNRKELVYAMDVLLEWRGLKLVPEGADRIKLVSLSAEEINRLRAR